MSRTRNTVKSKQSNDADKNTFISKQHIRFVGKVLSTRTNRIFQLSPPPNLYNMHCARDVFDGFEVPRLYMYKCRR